MVVGPSGAGKDTLIAFARERLAADPSVVFVKRVITRAAQPHSEDHDTLSDEAFLAQEAGGKFAVTWQAHGLRYGIPEDVRRYVAGGAVAIVNGSRAALPSIRAAFGEMLTVEVTCRPEILAARLAERGRENPREQKQRLARAAMPASKLDDAAQIDNSSDIETAGMALVGIIEQTCRART